jgi:hypothetical protein
LPKIPEQPHGAAVGQLVEIEVIDIFCMFRHLPCSNTEVCYQFDGPHHFQSYPEPCTQMRHFCNTDILAVLWYNLPSIKLPHIRSYTKFRYLTTHILLLNFPLLSMCIWRYADRLTRKLMQLSNMILMCLGLDGLVPTAFITWRVSLNWSFHVLFLSMATIH